MIVTEARVKALQMALIAMAALLLIAVIMLVYIGFGARATKLQLLATQSKLVSAQAALEVAQQTNDSCTATRRTLEDELTQCRNQWTVLTDRTARELEAARKAEAKAKSDLARFEAAWGAKTPSCGAALLALDRACPELKDY